ncbi:hypothetical protein AGLY_006363 [Aphis glycines]|uniref:Uncharacterized protein n=1 Tax=Aphis glycines TaxID=307491 RepID=A0A6G0TQU1_APHGL|nr:hypothetical protein AGLY_006363 [Aphis glycines]
MLQFRTSRVISDGKVNILGSLYRSKVKIFQQFSKNSIFYIVVTKKLITLFIDSGNFRISMFQVQIFTKNVKTEKIYKKFCSLKYIHFFVFISIRLKKFHKLEFSLHNLIFKIFRLFKCYLYAFEMFFLISYTYNDSKIIRIHMRNFFLLAFELSKLETYTSCLNWHFLFMADKSFSSRICYYIHSIHLTVNLTLKFSYVLKNSFEVRIFRLLPQGCFKIKSIKLCRCNGLCRLKIFIASRWMGGRLCLLHTVKRHNKQYLKLKIKLDFEKSVWVWLDTFPRELLNDLNVYENKSSLIISICYTLAKNKNKDTNSGELYLRFHVTTFDDPFQLCPALYISTQQTFNKTTKGFMIINILFNTYRVRLICKNEREKLKQASIE